MKTSEEIQAEEGNQRRREERREKWRNIVLLVIVLVVVYGTIVSQITSNKVADQGETRDRENACTSQVLFAAIGTLSQRSEFTTAQASANLKLQQAQAELLRTALLKTQVSEEQGRLSLQNYFDALTEYVQAVTEAQNNAKFSPYPTPEQYASCLIRARHGQAPLPLQTPTQQPSPKG